MANPEGSDSDLEWIEIFNNGSEDIDLTGWKIDETTIPDETLIPAQGYLVIARELIDGSDGDDDSFESTWGNANGVWGDDSIEDYLAIDGTMSLSNTSDTIILNNQKIGPEEYQETFSWSETEDDVSWQRIDPLVGDWVLAYCGATPGVINCVQENQPPSAPLLLFSTLVDQIVEFSWQESVDPEGGEISYEFYLGCTSNLGITDLIDSGFTETYFVLTQEELNNCSKYYWQIIASDGVLETASSIFSFEILEPVYSDNIIINELYPNPSGDSSAEWIELYNNSSEDIDLKDWILEDTQGSIHQYQFIDSTIIRAFGFLLLSRTETGITLNNDRDGVKLIKPNGVILYTTLEFSDGEKGWSFARTNSGSWSWTSQITPGNTNIITLPEEDEEDTDDNDEEEDEDIPKNTEPIEIKTGDYKNYEDYLIKITGEVVSTSGSTFYLDDGSGRVKIYIQSKTGIDKPPMQKGDVVEVIGIVNYYRGSWRILPQKQEDIKMIKDISEEAKTKKIASASTAKSSSASSKKSTSSTAKARSPTSKSVSSGVLGSANEIQVDSARSSFWIQFMKVFIGLAGILLILLVVKVLRFRKEKPLGGDFGDDYT